MKLVKSSLVIACLSFGAHAATLHQPDSQFIEQAAMLGVSQTEWDQGEMAAATFPNAYKFTRYYQVSKGSMVPEKWKLNNSLDLTKLKGMDADGEHDLYTILRDRLKNHSMVVIKGNEVVHQHFFNGMTPNSTHLDMSVTKSFTATLAGIAAAEGKLDMSKPLEFYLPEFKGTAFEGATVQEIADMRSGLGIKTPPHKSWDPRLTQSQEWHGKNDSGLHGIQDYLLLIKDHKYPSGEVYQYQDPNTEILGKVVEKVTGKELASYLEEKIWTKIGAENDAFWMADPDNYVVASGGLNMATRDLARVGKVIVNKGKNYKGEQVIPQQFLDAIWAGNDEVRKAWTKGKEYALANDAWYKDQYRVLNIKDHKLLVMIGIHGQVLAIDKASGVIVAMNGGYPQTETPRMANLLFYQVIPAIIDAVK
ncbi:serine hydrolase [Shewanella sp. WXL01]|uniref:serine hydrolase domain-containing protein n=1 Tax=Shewanella sp. WXL01 TaxID=2709721 RepID=UPI001438314C|nr:serine hydrolase [Shewanella sp. WXL01]NKF49135.1 serine hydrolase [Shewanella sp. WXL01]